MDIELRTVLRDAITNMDPTGAVVANIDIDPTGNGTIQYTTDNIWVDPSAPGFSSGQTRVTDEEMVRAFLVTRLHSQLGYDANRKHLEIERSFKPVGRPVGKGGRVDVVVRGLPGNRQSTEPYLFIECKAPGKFDSDMSMIDGQLFRLSRQEKTLPRYLVYYTVEVFDREPRERLILIDTESFPDFDSWDRAGQPIVDTIPANFGIARKRLFGNVSHATPALAPLTLDAGEDEFARLGEEIHDVIWGGGGTNNNEVFVLITRLLLAKIYDEKETAPGAEYAFQRLGDASTPESAEALVGRLNELYAEAEAAYLALPEPSHGPAFDRTRVAPAKIAYVVGRLEHLSVTENKHPGDLLGDFFERIIGQDFTQTKGQFFTPYKIVQFMLDLAESTTRAEQTMRSSRDHLGRPRLPYVIDPSCGSGTFLIEYMKRVRAHMLQDSIAESLPARVRESHATWFSGRSENAWARDFLFGVENNFDLGLAAKVNMVLHGDGSMNTWIGSGLLPFEEYKIDGRTNLLGVSTSTTQVPYGAPVNEQFDLIITNPPFSLTLSPDEKKQTKTSFDIMGNAPSEAIFIERWYQLLREDGRFICVLPEAVLDTSTGRGMREFMMKYFQMEAIVSLPYDAFRPFTSTKTAIVMARKRRAEEVRHFGEAFDRQKRSTPSAETHTIYALVFKDLGWEEKIFMAEPARVGYKRRKGLPDLELPNDLMSETPGEDSVLQRFLSRSDNTDPDSVLGFEVTPAQVCSRPGIRLDPKYRWLWDYENGVVTGHPDKLHALSEVFEIVALDKVPKGPLGQETALVDLDAVESKQAMLAVDPQLVSVLGSDKVSFAGADVIFSKLEPYLGKVLCEPDSDHVGSTEWVGLRVINGMPKLLATYLLIEPEMLKAYRRLQAGKRHARLDVRELLELKLELPSPSEWSSLVEVISKKRDRILDLRSEQKRVRTEIDHAIASSRAR